MGFWGCGFCVGIEEEEEEEVENSGVEGIEDWVEEGGGSGCIIGVWVVFGFGFVSVCVGVAVASMGSMEGEEGALLGACVSASFCLVWFGSFGWLLYSRFFFFFYLNGVYRGWEEAHLDPWKGFQRNGGVH